MSQSHVPEPLIAVVGTGAVGGLLAALLHRAGVNVVAVARPDTARAITANGLTVQSGRFGDGVSRVRVQTDIPEGSSVILATKAFALPAVGTLLSAAHPVEVISLLNGIDHLDTIREVAPTGCVAGGSVAVEATRLGPAVIDHRSPFLRLAVPEHAAGSAVVAAWRLAGLDVAVGGTDVDVLWSKFRFLAPLALITSHWQLPIGEALDRDPALTTELIREVAGIASRDGLPTTHDAVASALTALPPAMRSSLQNDLAAGRESELDAIGGALVRRGRSLGAPTRTVERLVTELTTRHASGAATSAG
jgi:2-dehydropantoate 2-reductase